MRILVTGVTGQLGAALASRLHDLGSVIATDRAKLDLSDVQSIPRVLDRLAPEIIVNTAAYTAVDKAEDEPELASLVNASAPGVIAAWASEQKVPLIHFSTDYVFDGTGALPWSEDDAPRPISAYGASKLAGEEAIRAEGGSFLIVRTSWVYASQGSNFLCTIARLAETRQELRVVADQIGAPTSAALVADAVARMLANGSDNFCASAAEANGLVHLAASGETSWHLFASEIVNGLKLRGVNLAAERVVPIRTEDYPARARRPHNSRLNLERLHTVFGITTPHWMDPLMPELDQLARELT
jgi:dTDP-4-dehydrorhamnose reductase